MCGADAAIVNEHTFLPGSPPRVRSRPRCCRTVHPPGRITSACAEQTPGHSNLPREARDHLRVCGADYSHVRKTLDEYGSPPRVRSRPHAEVHVHDRLGIISACAEQTGLTPQGLRINGDHLRVCGADKAKVEQLENEKGSPPRVRSRRCSGGQGKDRGGITSACAEQTNGGCAGPSAAGDHLRVCGADQWWLRGTVGGRGSPPRVRSRLIRHEYATAKRGITSACAEQTSGCGSSATVNGDHLRVCGADYRFAQSKQPPYGSPPRVRSRRGVTGR